MKVLENVEMSKYNTLRLNSKAKIMYFPECKEDMLDIVRKNINYFILGNGSNILINSYLETPIINTSMLNKKLEYDDITKTITCGCSVRIQELINFALEYNLGGIEYLFSLPAFVGGIVCMNAGRGRKLNCSISDYIVKVKYFNGKEFSTINYSECNFKYRSSIFKENNWLVYEVEFKLLQKSMEDIKEGINHRMNHVKLNQDISYPNCGSVFKSGSKYVFYLLKGFGFGGIKFSKKTPNWILNIGNGSYKQIKRLVLITKILNLFFLKKAEMELVEWKK